MKQEFLAAAVQMNSGEDKSANVARATALVRQAAQRGADVIALPELFNCLGNFESVVHQAEPIPGPTSETMRELAVELKVTLLAGSICERSGQASRGYNTSLLFSPTGEVLAHYRKIHLFDVDLPGRVNVTESNWIVPGEQTANAETPLGRFGLSICYDLRFPELYRRLANAQVDLIFAPAAFTQTTGRLHWEVLVRARAIENQAFVIAPNQCGRHGAELTTYGHSMIVDPWGTILARAGGDEEIICAEIDLEKLRDIRSALPVLAHRKLDLK